MAAFTLGIEVGASDRDILDYYANSGNRASEVVAFFLIAGAALAFVVFTSLETGQGSSGCITRLLDGTPVRAEAVSLSMFPCAMLRVL